MATVRCTITFDGEGFNKALPKRIALRPASEVEQVIEETVHEFTHIERSEEKRECE